MILAPIETQMLRSEVRRPNQKTHRHADRQRDSQKERQTDTEMKKQTSRQTIDGSQTVN